MVRSWSSDSVSSLSSIRLSLPVFLPSLTSPFKISLFPSPTHSVLHSPNVTPSRRGLTAPLALNESLALQSSVYERERARDQARAEHVKAREMEAEMARLSMLPGTAGGPSRLGGLNEGGDGKLRDELEMIRGQARMRAFM